MGEKVYDLKDVMYKPYTAELKADICPRVFLSLFGFGDSMSCCVNNLPSMVKKVIFNNPATIVMWTDGTKTVIKCHEEDTYDEVTGFLLCCMKKFLSGSSYSKFCDILDDVYSTKYSRLENTNSSNGVLHTPINFLMTLGTV